jgi:O-antigen ligase
LFAFFAVLLILALVSFGAVQSHVYLFVEMVWLAALAVLVVRETLATSRLSCAAIAYVTISAIAVLIDHRLVLALLAAGWGWLASQRSPLKTLPFLHVLIVVGVLEASLGLFQYFVAPGWIFGYRNPFYNSSGTLINHNHFAGLLEMIVPVTVAFAFAALMRGRDIARGYFYLFLGAFISIAIVFSTSRMGLFSCLITLLFLGAALRLKAIHKGSTALTLVVLGLVVAGALWIGVDIIVQRFAVLGTEDALLQDGRSVVYADTLKMIAAHPFGIGGGNYRDVFRQYQTWHPELLIDHAHNDYLETASEWGILPAVTFWIVVFIIFVRAGRSFIRTQSVERTTILLASMGAIFSILVHSLADFNLQIPSNAMLFFMFVGIAAQTSSSKPFPPAVK